MRCIPPCSCLRITIRPERPTHTRTRTAGASDPVADGQSLPAHDESPAPDDDGCGLWSSYVSWHYSMKSINSKSGKPKKSGGVAWQRHEAACHIAWSPRPSQSDHPLAVPCHRRTMQLMEFMYTMPKKCSVTQEQWDSAADRFELGLRHGNQLASELGVSAQTVMREMQRRGAIKGSRVHETVADLEALLDRKQLREADLRSQAEHLLAKRHAATFAVLDQMMAAIEHAAADGDVTLAGSTIDHAAMALGVRIRTKARRPR